MCLSGLSSKLLNLNPTEHLWDVLDKQVWSVEEPPHNMQDLKDLLLTSAVPDTAEHLQESSESPYRHDLGLLQGTAKQY